MKKQFVAKLLVLVMVLAMVPVTALVASAAGETASDSGNNNYYYVYSVAADTVVTVDDITDGKISAKAVGSTVLVPLKAEVAATLVKDGVLTLEVELDGDLDKVAISLPAEVLAEAGLDITTPLGKITISAEKLAKAIGDAKYVMIVFEVREDATYIVIYADWKVVVEQALEA